MLEKQKIGLAQGRALDSFRDFFNAEVWNSSFDMSDFDTHGIDVPESLPDGKTLVKDYNLTLIALADAKPDGELLFPEFEKSVESERRANTLSSIVVRAYQEVRCDRSVDYVVAEPESNLLFLHRCWMLGAAAAPSELNRILMNARKDSRVPSMSRAKPYSLDRAVSDTVSYAADIAMRELQNQLYFEQQLEVPSVDQILCCPELASRFDRFAAAIAPGYRSFDYRWAVLSLRKARRTKWRGRFPTRFSDAGLVEDITTGQLPTCSGLYWLNSDHKSLFVGVANNLHRQVMSFMERYTGNAFGENASSMAKPRLAVMEVGTTLAERFRSRLISEKGSALNFHLNKGLLSTAA